MSIQETLKLLEDNSHINYGKFADYLFFVDKPEQSAYKVEGLEPAKTASQVSETVEEKVEVDINTLVIFNVQNQLYGVFFSEKP